MKLTRQGVRDLSKPRNSRQPDHKHYFGDWEVRGLQPIFGDPSLGYATFELVRTCEDCGFEQTK